MKEVVWLIILRCLDIVFLRALSGLEDSICYWDDLELGTIIFFEPAEVFFYELEKEFILLKLTNFTCPFKLLLLSSLSHYHIRNLPQARNELLKRKTLPWILIALRFSRENELLLRVRLYHLLGPLRTWVQSLNWNLVLNTLSGIGREQDDSFGLADLAHAFWVNVHTVIASRIISILLLLIISLWLQRLH